jgi:hypothetical protein
MYWMHVLLWVQYSRCLVEPWLIRVVGVRQLVLMVYVLSCFVDVVVALCGLCAAAMPSLCVCDC